ncbi:hypothetical protein GCM10027047_14400 [Rhodococcus aerolatus]
MEDVHTMQVTHSAVARWALAVATVLAVIGMHALMGPASAVASTSHVSPTHATVAAHSPQHAPIESAPEASTSDAGEGHGGGHQPSHTLAHLCLAVLAGVVVALLVALTLAAFTSTSAVRVPWREGAGAGRAPPWTQLSLAQLSVLRV